MVVFVTSNETHVCPVVNRVARMTLDKWIGKLSYKKVYTIVDINNVTLYDLMMKSKDLQLVAIGSVAARELKEIHLEYFKLPDPSPRNAFLKNKAQVDAVVEECVKWLQK